MTIKRQDGHNWRVSSLAFLEQSVVADQLNYAGSFSAGTTEETAYIGGNEILKGLIVPVYRCPSSTLLEFPESYDNGYGSAGSFNNPGRGMGIHYVGIQGAAPAYSWKSSLEIIVDGFRNCNYGWNCNQGLLTVNETTMTPQARSARVLKCNQYCFRKMQLCLYQALNILWIFTHY